MNRRAVQVPVVLLGRPNWEPPTVTLYARQVPARPRPHQPAPPRVDDALAARLMQQGLARGVANYAAVLAAKMTKTKKEHAPCPALPR